MVSCALACVQTNCAAFWYYDDTDQSTSARKDCYLARSTGSVVTLQFPTDGRRRFAGICDSGIYAADRLDGTTPATCSATDVIHYLSDL